MVLRWSVTLEAPLGFGWQEGDIILVGQPIGRQGDIGSATVSDIGGDVTAATALTDDDDTTVTVLNVPPTVTAQGDHISEGGLATVRATFLDPGTQDTHTASILWGDGSPGQLVSAAALAAGVVHVYGDNGAYAVTVTVTDDDGGAGSDVVVVNVANLAPAVGSDRDGGNVIVTGGATTTEGAGWWKHQYSGDGSPHIDEAVAAGYLRSSTTTRCRLPVTTSSRFSR